MKHGAGIYKVAKKLACKPKEIIDFSSNINLFTANTNTTITKEMLARYGDNSYKHLKKIVAKKLSLKKSQIALYNGATSAIFELMRELKERDVYLYAPLYGEYEKAALHVEKKVHKINRFKALHVEPKKNSIVVFVNPSTPDAKHYNLHKLFEIWQRKNCTVILDESFLEFENLQSFRKRIRSYKKLYIIQSFTKFYSCAGVRIGAIFSNSNNIKKLQVPLWNLSSFDVEFLTNRLKDKEFKKQSKVLHVEQKKELKKILKKSKLFSKIYKSDANFFLVKSSRAKEIFQHLLKQKILVRTCDSFDFLGEKHLRFAVKSRKAQALLKKALTKI